jgi:hypothetical protein
MKKLLILAIIIAATSAIFYGCGTSAGTSNATITGAID